jgi:hypothetical protein
LARSTQWDAMRAVRNAEQYDDGLGQQLIERLRDELDQIQPTYSRPIHPAARRHPPVLWRVAPAALVFAAGAFPALTARRPRGPISS